MEREVSHSLVGRKCNFLQGVMNCDSRFGKSAQVNVSPVSYPVLYFGLKGMFCRFEEIRIGSCVL